MRRQIQSCQNWPPQGHTVKKPLSWYLNAGCPCLLTSSGTIGERILPGLSSSVYTECLRSPPSKSLDPFSSQQLCHLLTAASCLFPSPRGIIFIFTSHLLPERSPFPSRVSLRPLPLLHSQESSPLHCAFRNKILSPSKAGSAFLPTPAPIATDCLEVMWGWIPATGALPIWIPWYRGPFIYWHPLLPSGQRLQVGVSLRVEQGRAGERSAVSKRSSVILCFATRRSSVST